MRATKEAARRTVDLPTERAEQPATGSLPRNRPNSQQGWQRRIWLAARGLGALAVLAMGAVHLQQYLWLYSAIPTIGILFLLTFVAATVLGVTLLLPIERWAGRWGRAVLVLVTLGGVALAAVTFASLLVSENMPLFGFQEPGYDPSAIRASRAAEIAAIVFLVASLVWSRYTTPHIDRNRRPRQDGTDPRRVSAEHPDKEL